jgi:hypothetical protein
LSTELESQAYDPLGIRKIYPTKPVSEESFMKMDDLLGDPRVMNAGGENIKKKSDDSWESDGGDNGELRLEAWSPDYSSNKERKAARWLNVEITCHVKVMEKKKNEKNEYPPYAWQLYSRGGHHSKNNPCGASLYKGRWWNTKCANSFLKEICHPAYSANQATVENIVSADDGCYGNKRWYGAKLIMHNVVQNGDKYPKLTPVHLNGS